MNVKLIAVDMDGTFLDSSKRFSMEFFDIFEELRKRKIKFVQNNLFSVLVWLYFPSTNRIKKV